VIDPHHYHYRGVLKRAVDGDTIVVHLDLGLRVYTEVALRIAGINAPEINSGDAASRARGMAARDFLAQYEGWPVVLRTYKDKQSFNRYVADVYVRDTGANLGNLLVDAGHAVWVTA